MEVDDSFEALLALFGLYYCLNYQYSPHVYKALQFVQLYILQLSVPKVAEAVKELALYLKTY